MGNKLLDIVFILIGKSKRIKLEKKMSGQACMTKEDAIERAASEKRKNGYIDIVELAKYCGLRVIGKDLSNEESAYISYDEANDKFTIYVNANQCKERQRFSIAHELAHFIEHKDKIKALKQVDREGIHSLSPDEENEADIIAADILMPKDIFLESLSKLGIKSKFDIITEKIVNSLAKEFNVSFIASILRIRSLDFYVRYM